ncbi:MAG: pilin [Candidatus Paceibacterota bacterium]
MVLKHKFKHFSIIIGIVFLLFIAFPIIANAAACTDCGAIVCCGNEGQPPCDFAALFCLVQRVINFILFQLIPPLAVLWCAYAGFIMMTSAGDPAKFKSGKDMITYAVIGLLVAYSAWLLVYWFVSFIGGETQSNWLLQFFKTPKNP